MDYLDYIVSDPAICGGEPVIKGTRVPVRTIRASLGEGQSVSEILQHFPTLNEEAVRTVIALDPSGFHAEAVLWSFTESVSPDRAQRLLSWSRFEDIAALVSNAKVVAFECEPFGDARLKGCRRASFLLQVERDIYDAFFNSPAGYRAQYALSKAAGESANRTLLDALENRLLEFSRAIKETPEQALMQKSLRGEQAKIWIHEPEVEKQMGRSTADILYEPWERSSVDGAGLLAPVGTNLVVNGGWLDSKGNEQIDEQKLSRSEDLHSSGYT